MPWVISFLASWVVFFFTIDWSGLRRNIYGGLLALVMGTIVDWGGQKLNLYTFKDLIIPWFGCSTFYKFGPILTMGVLFTQHVPGNKWWQLINIIACTLLYLSLEYIIVMTDVAHYINWHILASMLVDILVFSSLTWFTITFIRSQAESRH